MTIEQIIQEIKYYTGKKRVNRQEAEEILWFVQENGCSLDEAIQAYYECI